MKKSLYIFLIVFLTTFVGCSAEKKAEGIESASDGIVSLPNEENVYPEEAKVSDTSEGVKGRIEGDTIIIFGKGYITRTFVSDFYSNNQDKIKGISKLIIEEGIVGIADGAFRLLPNINKIEIAGSVARIGDTAFGACLDLSEVVLHEGVTSIGSRAFSDCEKLQKIELPQSLEIIGCQAFQGTVWIQERQSAEEMIVNGILLDATDKELDIEKIKEIRYTTKYAFSETTWFEDIKDENNLVILNGILLDGSEANGEIYVPESVRYIADGAFELCSGVTAIHIPESVRYIGMAAFRQCKNLSSVTMGNNVEYIGANAFESCKNLKEIELSNSLKGIESWTFYFCTNLERVKLPETLEYINMYAFDSCGSLVTVDFPDSLNMIGLSSFSNCVGIIEIELPEQLILCGESAFYNCNSLQSVRLPQEMDRISSGMFSDCENLVKVHLPDQLLRIEDKAFYQTALTSVEIPKNTTYVGENAFAECQELGDVSIPQSVEFIGCEAFVNTPWLEGQKQQSELVIVNNILVAATITDECVELPENVVAIAGGAFKNNAMREIEIPDKVKEIGCCAFEGCQNLTSITLPENIKVIESFLFCNCISLREFHIPSDVEKIGTNAFGGCVSLKSIVIPDGVTQVDSYAFSGCENLISIAMPDSVGEISNCVFDECFDLSIYCNAGSYAEEYALQNGIECVTVDEDFWVTGAVMVTERTSLEEEIVNAGGMLTINEKTYHALWGETGALVWEYVEATFDERAHFRSAFAVAATTVGSMGTKNEILICNGWTRWFGWDTFEVVHIGDDMFLMGWDRYINGYNGTFFKDGSWLEDDEDAFWRLTDFNDGYAIGLYKDVYYTEWAGYQKRNEDYSIAFLDENANMKVSKELKTYSQWLPDNPGIYSDGCFYYKNAFYDLNSQVILDISNKDWGVIYAKQGIYSPYFENGMCRMLTSKNGKYWMFDIDKEGNILSEIEEFDITLLEY